MPAREIKKSFRNLTGKISSLKNKRSLAFESGLERDFLTLLEFDVTVANFEEQPVTIDVTLPSGKQTVYTPDVFVSFRKDIDMASGLAPLLCEVKYRQELFENWHYYKPRFKAARRYAKNRGWEFRIMTEKEIKTPLLENARFLQPYSTYLGSDGDDSLLLSWLKELVECDINTLLTSCTANRWDQARLLPVLWRLIVDRRVGLRIQEKITMTTTIWNVE